MTSVVAYGTHEELLRNNAEYRSVVARALDDEVGATMTELHTGLRNSAETWRARRRRPGCRMR